MPAEARRSGSGHRPGRGRAALILLVDNYDSFTYNLAHLFADLGAEVVVRRNDQIDVARVERMRPTHLIISPGPGRPGASGSTPEIVRRLAPVMPTLGVCLGHQAIVEAFGGTVAAAPQLLPGEAGPLQPPARGAF